MVDELGPHLITSYNVFVVTVFPPSAVAVIVK